MPKEIWMPIKGFEQYYSISSFGRIKSFHKSRYGRILSVKNINGWYLTVPLINKHFRKSFRIHRLVAEHFITNINNLPQVNHKNCNKQDNIVENLEWVTRRENMLHAARMKPDFLKGMIKYNTIIRPTPILQFDKDGRFINEYKNCKDASNKTGVCARNILQVANKTEYKRGKTRKQAGGFIWELKKMQ